VTMIDIQALSYSHILRNTVQINLVGYCCCFVIFGLTTNTDEIYQSLIPLNFHITPTKYGLQLRLSILKNVRARGYNRRTVKAK